ncbi:MAG TPA: hypothetical protein VGF96_05915 [Terracidiphilus sp.]
MNETTEAETPKQRRTARQMARYKNVKRMNYWLEHYGTGRQKFWRVGLKRLTDDEHMAVRFEEGRRRPYFIYDHRNPKRSPLRDKGNLGLSELWNLISPGETTEQMLRDVAAGKIPAGCYVAKETLGSPRHGRARMPRGYMQRDYLQPRTGNYEKRKRKPLVEESLAAPQPIAGHHALTAEEYSAVVTSLRTAQANIFQPINCPLCGAPKYAALQQGGLTLKCFQCRQSCDAGAAVAEATAQ